MTFWDHLEELRGSLIRMLTAVVVASMLVFGFKELLFSIILWPTRPAFPLFRWMGAEPFHLQLINTELTEQLMVHLQASLMAGVLIASPYILYILHRFISPGLYESERRVSVRIVGSAYMMFLMGVALNYLLIFPLTLRFLATYQVSGEVVPMLTLSNYVGTLLTMSFLMGTMFEIPVIAWLLARFGLLRSEWMARMRRHAIVVILIMAAIITPTSDAMTLLVVSLPIWLLYEMSIHIVRITQTQQHHA